MTGRFSITRRRFLLLAGGTTAVGLGWFAPGCRSADPAGRLLAVVDDRAAFRTLGSRWLADNAAAVQQANGAAPFVAELWADPLPVDALELRQNLSDRIRNDFAEGRIGHVGSWVLSHTEIRLCVLAATTTE